MGERFCPSLGRAKTLHFGLWPLYRNSASFLRIKNVILVISLFRRTISYYRNPPHGRVGGITILVFLREIEYKLTWEPKGKAPPALQRGSRA